MRPTPRLGALAFTVAALVLLAVLATLPPTGFFSADSGPKFWQCLAFAEGGGWPRGFDYPAEGLDPGRRHIPPFTAPVGDRLASVYPVLFPLLAAVPELVAGDRALRLLPWLAALVAAWATGRLASALRGEPAPGPAAATALAATPLAFYAIAFWEHSLASAMVVAGVLVVVEGERGDSRHAWRWWVLGLLVGLGAWVRTEVAFLAPLLLLAAAWLRGAARLRPVVAVTGGCALGLAGGAAVQAVTLGRWLPLHATYHAGSSLRTHDFLASRLASLGHFVAPHWSCGLAAAVWLAALAITLSRPGSHSRAGQVWGIAAVVVAVAAATVVPAARWLSGAAPTDAFPVSAPTTTWVVLSALPLLLWSQRRVVVLDRRRWLVAAVAVWSVAAVFVARPVRSFEWGGRHFVPAGLCCSASRRRCRSRTVPGEGCAERRSCWRLPPPWWCRRSDWCSFATARPRTTGSPSRCSPSARTGSRSSPIPTWCRFSPAAAGGSVASSTPPAARVSSGWQCSFAQHGVGRWTYATLERAPAGVLGDDRELVGADGVRWVSVLEEERDVGSERLRLSAVRASPAGARRGWDGGAVSARPPAPWRASRRTAAT